MRSGCKKQFLSFSNHLIFIKSHLSHIFMLYFTLLVQQHHDAVTMGVAIEMSRNDVTVLPADGDQPLVVALSYSSGVPDKGQVPHWYMSYDVHLEQEVSRIYFFT